MTQPRFAAFCDEGAQQVFAFVASLAAGEDDELG